MDWPEEFFNIFHCLFWCSIPISAGRVLQIFANINALEPKVNPLWKMQPSFLQRIWMDQVWSRIVDHQVKRPRLRMNGRAGTGRRGRIMQKQRPRGPAISCVTCKHVAKLCLEDSVDLEVSRVEIFQRIKPTWRMKKSDVHHRAIPFTQSAWFFKLQALMAPLPKSTERATSTLRHRPKSVRCPSVKVPEAHQTSLALPTGSTSAARTKHVQNHSISNRMLQHSQKNMLSKSIKAVQKWSEELDWTCQLYLVRW